MGQSEKKSWQKTKDNADSLHYGFVTLGKMSEEARDVRYACSRWAVDSWYISCKEKFVICFERFVTAGDCDVFKFSGPVWEPTLESLRSVIVLKEIILLC